MEKAVSRTLFIAVAVAVAASVVLFLAIGRTGEPGEISPEAGFARDMATHHAQAVEMSFIIRDKSESREIDNLAFDIINTQANQRGMFLGWLEQWELTQSTDLRPMQWMRGHGHAEAAATAQGMPGMASAQELTRLKELTGTEADVLFLQLMIRHHEGGVEMAEGLLRLSDRTEVVNMARKIVKGQQAEIDLMTDLLARRDAKPLPTILK